MLQTKSLKNPGMVIQRSIFGSILRLGNDGLASRLHGSSSVRPVHVCSQIPQNANVCSAPINNDCASSTLRNLGMKLGLVRIMDNVSLPHARSFSSSIQSGNPNSVAAGRTPGSMDYIQELLQDRGYEINQPRSLLQPQVESNADVVHIKLMRNNAFVTLTDSKGNKKLGISAGKLAGRGGKLTRYYGDAAAEDIGRKVRQMRTKSVVVKVNGFTFFKRKKDAILSFKDGFSHSQPNVNPIVYIEDTTRKPHNGCRLPKRRRI